MERKGSGKGAGRGWWRAEEFPGQHSTGNGCGLSSATSCQAEEPRGCSDPYANAQLTQFCPWNQPADPQTPEELFILGEAEPPAFVSQVF